MYDSAAWKELFGPLVRVDEHLLLTRIGLLLCIDGFPAFHLKRKGAISLMPAEFINLSLPPHMRYDPDNMIPWMLIPNDMEPSSQLKYFKFVIKTELNPMCSDGVDGPDGKVAIKVFGAAMDLKGKEKFYNQTSVQSYCGCSTCLVHYDQGPGGPIYAVARKYLPRDHPLRLARCTFKGNRYEFRNDELLAAPGIKTTQTLFNFAAMARRLGVEHYLGQKGPMMFSMYRGIQYDKFNILEWMHNLARSFDNFLDLLVGRDAKFDLRARSTSKHFGVFKSIWTPRYLSQVRTRALQALTDVQIESNNVSWCRRWLRVCGVQTEPNTRVSDLRRRVKELRNQVLNGERIVLPNTYNPLPWRLTDVAKKIVDKRVLRISYPHYTPVCAIEGESFYNRAGCWRTASKLLAFLVILVPSLRGFVPKLRAGLRSLIWGLRILEGQSFSVNEARELNLQPGGPVLKKSDIQKAKTLIIEGLAMIEGCCPIRCLVPALHCLCHYAEGAEKWGLLRLLWMISFGS